jgi:hypothetical protein
MAIFSQKTLFICSPKALSNRWTGAAEKTIFSNVSVETRLPGTMP